MVDSSHYVWHYRAGLFLSIHYLRKRAVPVLEVPLGELPQLSRSMIRFALWVYPRFLDRADLTFPIIVAGRGWAKITLDGRHRISKAIWTGATPLPTVHVPLWFATELLFPGVYEVEWLVLYLRGELRRAGKRLTPHGAHPHADLPGPGDARVQTTLPEDPDTVPAPS